MSNERETRTLAIEGRSFVIKTYATAREVNAIQQAYFKGAKVEIVGNQPKVTDFDPAVQDRVHQELIAQLVVSFDGDATNIVERCLDLPAGVYNDLVAALDDAADAKKKN